LCIKHFLLPATLIVGNLLCAHAFADTVVVRSGEHLGGRIVHKSGDTLILQTDYAGEIKIQWSKIVSIATDSPVTLQLDGAEKPVRGKLETGDPEQVLVIRDQNQPDAENAEATPLPLPLTRVVYINPLPEETHNGVNYKGRANLSVTKTKGNSNNEAVYAETAFTARAREYRYELNAKINRSAESGRLTNSNWLAGGNYDRFLDPKHFLYSRASVEHDAFKGIDQRDMVGGGYGLQLIDTPQAQLSVRGGLDYVNIRHTVSDDEQYPSLGWGVKYSHKLESYRAELFHEQEGFWNITDTRQLTLRTRSGLRMPLVAGITATSQLNFDWERRPEQGRKPTDSMLLFGLGYEW
jgi:putative salt-induced outer membrane protein YdiY